MPHKSVSLATPSFCCASLNSFQFVLTTVTELSRTECNINIPHTVYSACQAKIRSFMKIDYLNLPIPPVIMESLTIITPNLKNSIHPLIKVSSCFWWLSEMLAFLILTTVRGKPVDFGIQPQKASYRNNFVVLAGWGCQPQVQWVLCLFTAWEGSVLQAEELTSSQHAGRGEALWAHRKCWWEDGFQIQWTGIYVCSLLPKLEMGRGGTGQFTQPFWGQQSFFCLHQIA